MSAGSVSLEAALRTCKVDSAYANKVQSDRFLNPNNMVCPVWNGVDTAGREVCPDSFYTKRAGCNSAEDRVAVENNVSRPQYLEYITLSQGGIQGDIYDSNKRMYRDTMPFANSQARSNNLHNINKVTGNFGLQFGADVYPSCAYYPRQEALDQVNAVTHEREAYTADQRRHGQAMQNGYISNQYRQDSGF